MKKLLLMIACFVFCLTKAQAQNDTILTIAQIWSVPGHVIHVCTNEYDRVIVYAPGGCTSFTWCIGDEQFIHDESPVIFDGSLSNYQWATFYGCGYNGGFSIHFDDPNVPAEATEELWKRQHEAITLEAVGADSANMYSYFWPHSGETTRTVEVITQGTYPVQISDMCATSVRTKNVKESVEIDLATCDLESNLNLVTWSTNPAQALYIDHVIVKRDGLQVGTAPYSDGQFTDNIGSGSASRTYTVTAIATDGTECPIIS